MEKVKMFFKKVKLMLKQDPKKSWILIGGLILVVCLVVFLVAFFAGKDNDKKEVAKENAETVINDNAGIIKEATYSGLTINNIILKSVGNQATFTATVTNNSGEEKNIEDFDIVLKKGDTEVVTLYAYLGEPLKDGESRDITSSVGIKLPKTVVDTAIYQEHK